MTEKDFSTIKKILRTIQKVQATATVYTMWVHFTHYDDGIISVNVTLFKRDGDTSVAFDFYSFRDPGENLNTYNQMINFINGK